MVRSKTEQNDQDQAQSQTLNFGLFLTLRGNVAAHRRQDPAVSHEHGCPWSQEAQKSPVEVHPSHPVLHGVLLEAEGVIEPILEELVVEEGSGVGYDLDDPHDGTDQDGCVWEDEEREKLI